MRFEQEWRLTECFEGVCALRFHLVRAWARSWQHPGLTASCSFAHPSADVLLQRWWHLVAACGVARVALRCALGVAADTRCRSIPKSHVLACVRPGRTFPQLRNTHFCFSRLGPC